MAANFLPHHRTNILISGTNNRFGKRLLETLAKHGYTLFVINLHHDADPVAPLKVPNVHYIKGSVVDSFKLEKNFRLKYIIDVSSFEQVNEFDYSRLLSIGSRNLLDISLRTGASYLGVLKDWVPYFTNTSELNQYLHKKQSLDFYKTQVTQYIDGLTIKGKLVSVSNTFILDSDSDTTNFMYSLGRSFLTEQPLALSNDGLDQISPLYEDDSILEVLKILFTWLPQSPYIRLESDHTYTVSRLISYANTMLSPRLQLYSTEVLAPLFESFASDIRFETVPVTPSVSLADLFNTLNQQKNPPPELFNDSTDSSVGLPHSYTGGGFADYSTLIDLKRSPRSQQKEVSQVVTSGAKKHLDFPSPKKLTRNLISSARNLRRNRPVGTKDLALPDTFVRNTKKPIKPRQLLKFSIVIGVFSLIFVSVVFPFIVAFAGSILGAGLLKSSLDHMHAGDREKALADTKTAQLVLKASRNNFASIRWLYTLSGNEETSIRYDNLLYVSQNVASALTTLVNSSYSLEQIFRSIKRDSDTSLKEKIALAVSSASTDVDHATRSIEQAHVLANSFTQEQFPAQIPIEELKTQITQASVQLSQAKKLLAVLPTILGLDGEKTYLVLLQNSSELRPTGGFIGSYALLKLNQGSITAITVDDVYNVDGNIQNPLPAPTEFKTYLGLDKMYLRDSNWDPNFVVTAFNASKLYSGARTSSVDGVIAVNLQFFNRLMSVVGPVTLQSSNEVITSENFAEKALYNSEVRYFPGSTGKKDFLGSVAAQALTKLFELDNKQLSSLLLLLQDSVEKKDMLFFSSDALTQEFFVQSDMAGEIKKQTESKKVFSNFTYVVDANVGINKADQFIKRTQSFVGTFDRDGKLTSRLTLEYAHTGNSSSWPSGNYKSYTRVYLPLNSTEISVQSESALVPVITSDLISGKTVVAFPIQVDPGQNKKFVVEFTHPQRLSRDITVVSHYLQKQPGTTIDQASLRYDFPAYVHIHSLSDLLSTDDNVVHYRGKVEKDTLFEAGVQVD